MSHRRLPTTPRVNQTLISASELKDAGYYNLYDLIQARRPFWLQAKFTSGGVRATPEVFIDDRAVGRIEALRGIPLGNVMEIRYFEPSEAAAAFGPQHANGVIRVQSQPSQ